MVERGAGDRIQDLVAGAAGLYLGDAWVAIAVLVVASALRERGAGEREGEGGHGGGCSSEAHPVDS